VPTAVTDFGAAIGAGFGALLGLGGASASSASSSQVAAAAAAVSAAQAAQAQQTLAIQSQLPKFYGGSGTSGLNAQVEFSGSLPSSFTQPAPPTSTGTVAFDAAGSGGDGNGSASLTGTHDGTAGATALVYVQTGSGAVPSSVNIGSASGTLLGSVPGDNSAAAGVLLLFEVPDIPGGEQTVDIAFSEAGTFESISYTGVNSVGAPFTAFGSGTALSQAISCASGQMISHAFGGSGGLGGSVSVISGGTTRFQGSFSNDEVLLVQDSTASATFAATGSAPTIWSGIGVVLSAAASSAAISRFTALLDEVADTDQETVSGIWSSPIVVNGGARYLFLRVNSGFSSYLFVKWFATGNINAPVFNASLGCVVAGVEHVFTTFTESTAATAEALINASANNNISLEATAEAISFTYPQVSGANASLAFTDTSGISQIGASFRQAGFGTDESPVVFPLSFAFFDSGPTSGPQASPIITPQTSLTAPPTGAQTTTSTTFAELATTTDQVTVNIGPSGIALVFLSCTITNSGAGQANYVGFSMSGENTAAASFDEALDYQAFAGSDTAAGGLGGMFPQTGLAPGATTFKMEYAVSGGTGTFWNRRIFVLPI
jgi:hypothetical protein